MQNRNTGANCDAILGRNIKLYGVRAGHVEILEEAKETQ